jgi:hypothetical protein
MHMAGVLISFTKRSGDRLWKDVLRKNKPPRGQSEAGRLTYTRRGFLGSTVAQFRGHDDARTNVLFPDFRNVISNPTPRPSHYSSNWVVPAQ